MAHVNSIFTLHQHIENKTFLVEISLKPSGIVKLTVPVPPKFFDALMNIAQTAADAHEAQMRAEILGDIIEPKGVES